jgi:hypothetical protein
MATAGAAIALAVTAAETITAAEATRPVADITVADKPCAAVAECALAAVAAECMPHQRAATAAVVDTRHPRITTAVAVIRAAVVDTKAVVVVDIRAAVAVAVIKAAADNTGNL